MGRIILIDDDIDLAEMVKMQLTAEGHQVFVINSGKGAFELAKQVKPEIAILDIMLPGVTGFQISRSSAETPNSTRWRF